MKNFALSQVKTRSHAGVLAAAEGIGWKVGNVGHVFVVTGESSRDKFMATGQPTAVSGATMGISSSAPRMPLPDSFTGLNRVGDRLAAARRDARGRQSGFRFFGTLVV